LRTEIDGLIPVDPRGDKHSRFAAASALFEAGNVWLPHPTQAAWVTHAVNEITLFPKFATDDVVDSLSQALAHIRIRATGTVDMGKSYGGEARQETGTDLVSEESYWS